MRRYRTTISDKELDITVREDGDGFVVTVDGAERRVSVADVSPRRSHYLVDNLSREVDLVTTNDHWSVFIEGRQFDATVHDYHLSEIKKTAGVSHKSRVPRELRAPMPGKVLKLAVAPGDSVAKGDTLLVLEAMKMENLVRATGDGTVEKTLVEPGASVEKGEPLIKFADSPTD